MASSSSATAPETDIAISYSRERMMTEATGRKPFQKVYLWTMSSDEEEGAPSRTTETYNPEEDEPSASSAVYNALPAHEELIGHENGKLCLEVGLIIGSDPFKYVPKGKPHDKKA
ncbi:Uu.00g119770.m01.CDS01 [Anthostomella pinea]|uniref:Uu.00g119770.m01.CDS01 n=1 Tax=Anthostomella pinea TaxID=933095 RepID=A0AAI8VGL4_9PEZI|nr:Uu.00g119770.m01.CDS01 [Anthostomella pinea]